MSKISLKCVIKFGVNSQANNTHAKGVTKHAQMPLKDRTLDYNKIFPHFVCIIRQMLAYNYLEEI